jgi:hypothetical protein
MAYLLEKRICPVDREDPGDPILGSGFILQTAFVGSYPTQLRDFDALSCEVWCGGWDLDPACWAEVNLHIASRLPRAFLTLAVNSRTRHCKPEPNTSCQRGAIGTRTITLVVVAILIVGALGFIVIYYAPSPLHPLGSSTTRTCTVVYGTNDFYSLYCPEPLRISGTNGPWNFTVTISTDSVTLGQSILLDANLTNTAGTNQTVNDWVVPFINPGVYSPNGTQLWGWNPPQRTLPNMTFANGQVVTESVRIPTSGLKSEQDYFIKLEPLSIQFHLNDGETPYSLQFTVH